ncbi:hypothetical protein B0H13DRAFT_1903833 [Mycena leptocephala]|nr:hypothetical protein B0H13DRAFT_1903833 [Mycena leptocephala]
MNLEFEQHSFRQEGHEKESPQHFIGRRTRAVRLLANSDDGGPLEVFLVMRRAPIVWSTILVLENIQSSEDLYDKVNEHEESLVAAFKREGREPGEMVTNSANGSSIKKKNAFKVQIEEIEDEEWEKEARRPKATRFTIEEATTDLEAPEMTKEEVIQFGPAQEENSRRGVEPPPSKLEPVFLRPKRSPRPGDSALGVSVLAIKGWVESVDGAPIDLRLDLSGHRMSLAQLTDQGTVIKGFVKLKIFTMTINGELLGTEAEAYVVKGMTVPILLGEDYQLNFEMGVRSKIIFRNTPYEVEATGIGGFEGQSEAHAIAARLTVYAEGVAKARAHNEERKAKASSFEEWRWRKDDPSDAGLPH